ncbi:MAG TPA: hypothetical protein VHT52_19195, partial [Stellaceae bacterium]|nr:hypothetical protein [Stellaceae bacterium]
RHGTAPALALCRLLIDVGYAVDRPLMVFRNGELAQKFKTIGWAAEFGPRQYEYRWVKARPLLDAGVRAKRRKPRRAANDPRIRTARRVNAYQRPS